MVWTNADLANGVIQLFHFVELHEFDAHNQDPARISFRDLNNLQLMTWACMPDVTPATVRPQFLSLFLECQPYQAEDIQPGDVDLLDLRLPAVQLKMMLVRWNYVKNVWNNRQRINLAEPRPFDAIEGLEAEVGNPIVCFNGRGMCAPRQAAFRRMLVTQNAETMSSRDFENQAIESIQVVIYNPNPDEPFIDYEDDESYEMN